MITLLRYSKPVTHRRELQSEPDKERDRLGNRRRDVPSEPEFPATDGALVGYAERVAELGDREAEAVPGFLQFIASQIGISRPVHSLD